MKKIKTLCVVGIAGVMLAGGALASAPFMPGPVVMPATCPVNDAALRDIAVEGNIVRPEIGVFNGKWSTVKGEPSITINEINKSLSQWEPRNPEYSMQKIFGHTYEVSFCSYYNTTDSVDLQKFVLIK